MNVKEKVNSWLQSLNEKRGESFTIDDKGKCKFFYKDGIFCTLEVLESEELFYLYSPLTVVADGNTAVMRRALEANLFQIVTAGSVIAIDKSSNSFVISFVGKINNFNAETFTNQLCVFLSTALSVREILTQK